jgi:hypothetical protein
MSNCYYCGPRCRHDCTYLSKKTLNFNSCKTAGSHDEKSLVLPAPGDGKPADIGDVYLDFSTYSEVKAFSVEELQESMKKMAALAEPPLPRNSYIKFDTSLKMPPGAENGVWTLLEPNSYSDYALKKMVRNPISSDRERSKLVPLNTVPAPETWVSVFATHEPLFGIEYKDRIEFTPNQWRQFGLTYLANFDLAWCAAGWTTTQDTFRGKRCVILEKADDNKAL